LYEHLAAKKVYVVTYPGPDGLCDGQESSAERGVFETIFQHTRDVLAAHSVPRARTVLVVHSECAGHEVSEEAHRQHAIRTAQTFNDELSLHTPVEPLIAIKGNSDLAWRLESCL